MKIWFITRSYPPQKGGGPQMRELQVDFLRKSYEVEVITINHENNIYAKKDNISYLPYLTNRYLKKASFLLAKYGLLLDPYNIWINNAYHYVNENISDNDIIFSTTGGELSSIIVGDKIKNSNPSIKHIINYHDLLTNSYYDGERESKGYYKRIDILEGKYLKNADFILSNSDAMTKQIIRKFSFTESKIDKLYFGFRNNFPKNNYPKRAKENLKIVHIGSVSHFQSPEILIKAWQALNNEEKERIELVFIGNISENKFINDCDEIEKIDFMPRNEMIEFIYENIDMGFISLINSKSFESAMPTKFYEYIGLELPIIGALPRNSEVLNTINNSTFGKACIYDVINDLTNVLSYLVNNVNQVSVFRRNIINKKDLFDSKNTLKIMSETIDRVKNDY